MCSDGIQQLTGKSFPAAFLRRYLCSGVLHSRCLQWAFEPNANECFVLNGVTSVTFRHILVLSTWVLVEKGSSDSRSEQQELHGCTWIRSSRLEDAIDWSSPANLVIHLVPIGPTVTNFRTGSLTTRHTGTNCISCLKNAWKILIQYIRQVSSLIWVSRIEQGNRGGLKVGLSDE